MKKTFLFIFLFTLIICCSDNSPYPGFSRGKHGIYYQLHEFGESSGKAKYQDYITADLTYMTFSDSVFFEGVQSMCYR